MENKENPMEMTMRLSVVVGEERFSELEVELRDVDIPNTNFDKLALYLGNLITVSSEQIPYAQEFRDAVVAELKTRPEYDGGHPRTPDTISRWGQYCPSAVAAGRFLNAHGINTH